MKAKIESKLCGVCGDKALGYNFNAITCESCKAFFRRNALIQKEFKCPFNSHCDITTVTRRFCQKCRLDKCFSIGMCKDLIMSEQDKVAKRQKIEENRAKKRVTKNYGSYFKRIKNEHIEAGYQETEYLNSVYDTDSDSKETSLPETDNQITSAKVTNVSDHVSVESVTPRIQSEDLSLNERLVSSSDDIFTLKNNSSSSERNKKLEEDSSRLLNRLMDSNNASCRNNGSNNNINNNNPILKTSSPESSIDVTREVVDHVQRVNGAGPSSIESILCEAIKLEYEAFSTMTQSHSNSRELNDAERAKLNELIVANKSLLMPLDEEINSMVGEDGKFKDNPQQKLTADPALLDIINLTAIVIKRLIKMAKKINAFKNMCQEDQVALLKGGCTEIMILRSTIIFDPATQIWKLPHSNDNFTINADVLKQAKNNIYKEHDRFIKTLDPKWRADENIILILCAIILFTPDRQKVIHRDVIKLEQNSYYYLLRRYLESIYVGCEAKSAFLKLIQKISELHKLNEELINVYLDVNPSEVEPLLLEIFDLKH